MPGPRPNNRAAISAKILGLSQAKAAFQKLPEIAREEYNRATWTTLSEIARIAKQNILANPSVRTRALYDHVGFTLNEKSGQGRVGIRKGETRIVVPSAGGGKARTIRVKGIIVAGRNGSALRSQGAKVIRPTSYGHLVEFRHKEPFMVPAAKAQQQPYLDRMRVASRAIEKQMAKQPSTGGGLL
jgi:hypothetical protein